MSNVKHFKVNFEIILNQFLKIQINKISRNFYTKNLQLSSSNKIKERLILYFKLMK